MAIKCDMDGCRFKPIYGVEGYFPTRCQSHNDEDMVILEKKAANLCRVSGCRSVCAYGMPGGRAFRCKKHIIDGMIDVKNKKCIAKGCQSRPNFAYPGEKAQYCVTHKLPEMVDVKNPLCAESGCRSRPSFGYPDKKASHCAAHQLSDMVDVRSKRCKHEGCQIRPTYGYPADKSPTYCSKHGKLIGMINIHDKRCQFEGCQTQPTYGFVGKKAIYCRTHKLSDMIDVKNKKCMHEGCPSQPSYGFSDGPAQYCVTHKLSGMIDVKSKRCIHEGCETQASFAYPGEKRQYCASHRLSGMIDVAGSRCMHEGCQSRPSYSYMGEKPQYCLVHRLDGMVNVVSKGCMYPGCQTKPWYGYLGYAPTHCAKHRSHEMCQYPLKKCSECKKKAVAMKMEESSIVYFCEEHRTSGAIEFVNACMNCACYIERDTHMCYACRVMIDAESGKVAKPVRKEQRVADWLTCEGYEFVRDTGLAPTDCDKSRKRPDFLIQTEWGFFILEVDEHQHKDRACSCETARMQQIYHDLGYEDINIVFIRYNPDKYTAPDHIALSEAKRKTHLFAIIDSWIDYKFKSGGHIYVEYLFYDGCMLGQRYIDCINPYDLDGKHDYCSLWELKDIVATPEYIKYKEEDVEFSKDGLLMPPSMSLPE